MNAGPQLTIPVHPEDHAQGSATAAVTLVEYGDYQCPYCGAAYPLVQELQQRFGAQLRFVFRNFPLTQAHPLAQMAAELAEAAAAQGKFWPMHDWIYENQPQWTAAGEEALLEGIVAVGLDTAALERALKQPQIAQRIKADFNGGVRSGVNGTPSFFVNGRLHQGAPQALAKVIEHAIGPSVSRAGG
jgi:protein-disulfide isomerase